MPTEDELREQQMRVAQLQEEEILARRHSAENFGSLLGGVWGGMVVLGISLLALITYKIWYPWIQGFIDWFANL